MNIFEMCGHKEEDKATRKGLLCTSKNYITIQQTYTECTRMYLGGADPGADTRDQIQPVEVMRWGKGNNKPAFFVRK
jgi:hypothetical protein